jgi:hypothetical protein
VDRRLLLTLAWGACVLVAAAVGFGAANLVGDAIEDTPLAVGSSATTQAATPTSATSRTPKVTPSASPTPTRPATRRVTPPVSTTSASLRGSRSTAGGVVTATCSAGKVRVSASPASGWRLDSWTTGLVTEAQVEFRRNEAKVEVHVTCAAGGPRFDVETSDDASHSGGGSGSGG